MATQKNSDKINLYNLALLSLQGFELENAETIKVGGENQVIAYMRKQRKVNSIRTENNAVIVPERMTKINTYVVNLSSKAGSLSSIEFSKRVSEELERYSVYGKHGIKPGTHKVLRTFLKAQNSQSIENNIQNGSFHYNVEKMFADLIEATAYSDVNLMFKLRNLSDNLDKNLLGENSNIKENLSNSEVLELKESLKHLNDVVTGKEPSNIAKSEQARVR